MAEAKHIIKPKFTLYRLENFVILKRDNGVLLKMYAISIILYQL